MDPSPEQVDDPASRDLAVPRSLVVTSEWAWRGLVIGSFIAVLIYLATFLSFVLVPVIIATFFTATLEPIRDRLLRLGMGRNVASALACVVGFVLIGGAISLAASQVISNFDELARQTSEGLQRISRNFSGAPFHLKSRGIENALDTSIERFRNNPGRVLSGAFSVLITTGGLLAGGLLTFVTTLFFVIDRRRIFNGVTAPLGPLRRARVRAAGRAAWRVLCSYVQVTLTEAFVVAIFIGSTAAVVGIPIPFTMGVIVFILGFIPTIGAIVSGIIVTMAAYVTQGFTQALVVAIVAIVVQQLDANVLYPYLTSRRLSIHPLASILLVTSGGVIAGLFGAFVAVPLAAMLLAARGSLVGNEHELDIIAPP